MQTHFYKNLLLVEQAVIRTFKTATIEAKHQNDSTTSKVPAASVETQQPLNVTLKQIQCELGEDLQAKQFIDQLSFVKRISNNAQNDPAIIASITDDLDLDRFQLTNLQFAEGVNDTAPRLVSINVTMNNNNSSAFEKVTLTEDEQKAQVLELTEKLQVIIGDLLDTVCFGHVRFMACEKFSDQQQSVELLYSSASHSASLALRKALLTLNDKNVTERLAIDFLPSLNVEAKPFQFDQSLFSDQNAGLSNANSVGLGVAPTSETMVPPAAALSEAEIKRNQIAQLYEYYNGLLVQDQLVVGGGNKMGGLPRLGNPHHFAQNSQKSPNPPQPQQETLSQRKQSPKKYENVLVSDDSFVNVERNLNLQSETANKRSAQLVIHSGLVDDEQLGVTRKYTTKEILSIFKMCGRFQSPIEHPEPYGENMDLEVLVDLLTKKPQVVLEHMRSHSQLPLMNEHGASVTNKLLMNFSGQGAFMHKPKPYRA